MQDRHRQIECDVCYRPMRSNNLHRHKKTHKDLLSLPDNEIKDELQSREEFKKKREEKIQKIEEIAKENNLTIPDEIIEKRKSNEIDDIRTRCLQNYQLYLEKIEIGKQVATIIENGEIIYESLGRSDKEAFDTYRKYIKVDISNITLRKWQSEAMELFDLPTEREVIWVTDTKGGTGKTFFQKYLISYFGRSRVASMDLRIKHSDACNVLKKLPLPTIDIFLFNDGRSQFGEENIRLLEDIKDGQATASKYDNDNLKFKTPNTVMVFSNGYPNLLKLSSDRWRILRPTEEGLDTIDLEQVKEITKKSVQREHPGKMGFKR